MKPSLRDLAAAAIVVVGIVSTASASGGYFPEAWGWAGFALALAAAGALILVPDFAAGKLELLTLGALAALLAWIGLSTIWSESPPRSILEIQRDLVYLTAVGAVILLASRRPAATLATAALIGAGVVSLWGLATRLAPDRFGLSYSSTGQLSEPVGYWNTLGILTVLALLLALGAATERARARYAAAALTPLLVATLYLTFSRGAWLALAVGLAILVALHPARHSAAATIGALAAPAAAGVWLASRAAALRDPQPQLDAATASGHRLASELAVLALVAAATPALLDRAAARWKLRLEVPQRAVRALTALAATAGVLAVIAFAGRAYDSFRSPTVAGGGGDLNARLFSASGNARADYWRVAWHDVVAHPILGSGAGTYELEWYRERPTLFGARDAHNLYLETLAELGPLGLALLAVALACPLVAARRSRAPLGAAAAAAYSAYLAHAAVDWDWEMPTVTLAAVACGCALLVGARPERLPPRLHPRARAASFTLATAVAVFAVVGYAGSLALESSASARQRGDLRTAERFARRAARLQPWQAEPWSELGESQLADGKTTAAANSFRRAVAKDRGDWFPWYELALATSGRERDDAVREALRRNPRGPELVLLRGR